MTAEGPDPSRSGSGRDETEDERVDRNLGELLGELRVALPGVQVLFAFLLVVPFNTGFKDLTPGQERLYLATLLSAGLASALLIAPTAHHRMTFRLQDKPHLVILANRFAIAGLAFLAVAMTGAIGLVTDVVFGATVAAVSAGLIGLVFVVLWLAWPFTRRVERERGEAG
ncbi:MAG: DUF6328 family protein [Actinobacteria bacterium]|nr:DUF6328 family protein [Actinomycetota bacterium]